MQAATTLPIAAGAILFATIAINAANPKRSKSSGGFSSSTGASRMSVDNNRAMQFSSPEFGGSLSAARRSPAANSFSQISQTSRHSRTQSLNRNVPHTPSATISMSETLHSRNTPMSGTRRTTGQQAGSSQRVHRRPGHYPSQSLPEFTFPTTNRNTARRPTTHATGFLASTELGSENRDQRLPVTLF